MGSTATSALAATTAARRGLSAQRLCERGSGRCCHGALRLTGHRHTRLSAHGARRAVNSTRSSLVSSLKGLASSSAGTSISAGAARRQPAVHCRRCCSPPGRAEPRRRSAAAAAALATVAGSQSTSAVLLELDRRRPCGFCPGASEGLEQASGRGRHRDIDIDRHDLIDTLQHV